MCRRVVHRRYVYTGAQHTGPRRYGIDDGLSMFYSLSLPFSTRSPATPAVFGMIDHDDVRGALLGTAVGDALGMPIEGMSHQNVRTYYKGIKEFRGDEKRGDLAPGQWTDDTQLTFALTDVLAHTDTPKTLSDAPPRAAAAFVALQPVARRWGGTTKGAVEALAAGAPWQASGIPGRPTNGAAMRAAPLGVWWAMVNPPRTDAVTALTPLCTVTHRDPAAVVGALAQAYAIRYALQADADAFAPSPFWDDLCALTTGLEDEVGDPSRRNSRRLAALTGHLDDFPLDLQEICDGTGGLIDESWPFVVAMFARNPRLTEATLLSAINVGGDTDTIGAMLGALLGALNGWTAFPDEWHQGLEDSERLKARADALYHHLVSADAQDVGNV